MKSKIKYSIITAIGKMEAKNQTSLIAIQIFKQYSNKNASARTAVKYPTQT